MIGGRFCWAYQRNYAIILDGARLIMGLRPRAVIATYRARAARVSSELLHAALRERLVRTHDLPRGVRLLTLLGYISVVSLLIVQLFLDLYGGKLPHVRFHDVRGQLLSVPLPGIVFSTLAFVLGWALLLTGASDCRRRVFLPIVGVFVFHLLVLSPYPFFRVSGYEGEGGTTLWGLLAVLLVGVPVTLHFFTRRTRYWSDAPLLEFAAWLAVGLVFTALLFNGDSLQLAAAQLYNAFFFLALFGGLFFFLSGLELADFAVSATRGIVMWLGYRLPSWVIHVLVIPPTLALLFLLSVALLGGGELLFESGNTTPGSRTGGLALLVVSLFCALPLLWGLRTLLARRWTIRATRILLAYTCALVVILAGIWQLATTGQDFTEAALSAINVLPPGLLFVGLMTLDVLNFGVRFANTEGRIMPRTGRVTLYFGSALLMICFALFFLNLRMAHTGKTETSLEELNIASLVLGTMLLGLPYFVWVVWKRRDRLVGESRDVEFSSSFDGLWINREPGRSWSVAGILLGLPCGFVNLVISLPLTSLLVVVMGVVGYRKNDKLLGTTAIVLGAGITILSWVFIVT